MVVSNIYPPLSKTSKQITQEVLQEIKKQLDQIKPGKTGGFYIFPKKVKFETQEKEEEIILLLRRHFFTNIPWIIIGAGMLILPFFLPFFPIIAFLPGNFQFMTIILWYLITFAFILESFLSWYYNIYIVTDERIIDVDFYSLIYKRISQAQIDKIEDVTYSQGGFSQSMFDYGTVIIQTAGEVPEFGFEAVPKPAMVAKVINQLILKEEDEERTRI